MNGIYLRDDDLFLPKVDKDANLFDDPDNTLVSGNKDLADSIKHVCLCCGGINGQHSVDCEESIIT